MNGKRRTVLCAIAYELMDIRDRIDSVRVDEEEARDNIPENLQGTARYEAIDEACDGLNEAVDGLDDIVDTLTSMIER